MNRVRLHRILPALALGALLTVPCAWAAPRERVAGTVRAQGIWAQPWDFVSQLWSRAVHWASKNGLSVDPSGAPTPQADNGPSVDPHGAFPPGTKNGPSIDPSGNTGAQSSPPPASSSPGGS